MSSGEWWTTQLWIGIYKVVQFAIVHCPWEKEVTLVPLDWNPFGVLGHVEVLDHAFPQTTQRKLYDFKKAAKSFSLASASAIPAVKASRWPAWGIGDSGCKGGITITYLLNMMGNDISDFWYHQNIYHDIASSGNYLLIKKNWANQQVSAPHTPTQTLASSMSAWRSVRADFKTFPLGFNSCMIASCTALLLSA